MFTTEATAVIWVFATDLQDVFEQEAFPLESSSTNLTAETLSRSGSFPFVSDAEQLLASSLFPRRSESPILFGPVTVWITIAVNDRAAW